MVKERRRTPRKTVVKYVDETESDSEEEIVYSHKPVAKHRRTVTYDQPVVHTKKRHVVVEEEPRHVQYVHTGGLGTSTKTVYRDEPTTIVTSSRSPVRKSIKHVKNVSSLAGDSKIINIGTSSRKSISPVRKSTATKFKNIDVDVDVQVVKGDSKVIKSGKKTTKTSTRSPRHSPGKKTKATR